VPAWLVWLLPVPLATLSAVAWVVWSSRVRGPADPADSVAAYERFRRALAAPPPERRS
jgi:cytochrome c-type biogenesis protein CcmH/NrfF